MRESKQTTFLRIQKGCTAAKLGILSQWPLICIVWWNHSDCVCVCVCACLSVYLSLCACIYISVCVCVCVCAERENSTLYL
jgi:hypothetical protein